VKKRPPPEDLEELLDRFDEAADRCDKVSLDLMMDEVGRRSFGPLLLLAGMVMVAPVIGDIPGVPVLLGSFVLLVAVQLLLGWNHFWLPQWLLRRSVDSGKVKKATRKWLRRPARFIDKFLRHRLQAFTGNRGTRAIAIACTLLALATPAAEFVPFSANGIGAGVAVFGLALIAHDGLVALIGWVLIAVTVGLAAYGLM
jgi:hypothetical protein